MKNILILLPVEIGLTTLLKITLALLLATIEIEVKTSITKVGCMREDFKRTTINSKNKDTMAKELNNITIKMKTNIIGLIHI